MKGARDRNLPPPLPKSSPPRESDYEEIDLYRRNLASRPGMSSAPGLPKKGDGRHCDLCGSSTPIVRCDKCNNQLFCLSCDDMYHRHPKRQSHIRKAIEVCVPVRTAESSTRPPLPPKSEHAVPPQPPPRRKPRPPGFVTPMLPRKEIKPPAQEVKMTPMTVRKEIPIPKPVELTRKTFQTPLSPTTQKKQLKPPSTPSLMRKDFLDKVGSLGRKLMGSVSDLRSPSISRKEIPPAPPPKASQSQFFAPKASPIGILKKPASNVTRTDSGVSLSSYQSDETKLRGQNQPIENLELESARQQMISDRNGSQQSLVDFQEEQLKLTARQRSCSVAGLWAGTPGTAMPPNGRNFDPQPNFGSLGRRFNGSNNSLSGPPKMSASSWDLQNQQPGFQPLHQAQSVAHIGCTTCSHGWNGGWEHHMHHHPMNYPMQYPWDMGMRRTPSTLSMPGRAGPDMLMPGSWHHPSPMMYPMPPAYMMPPGGPPAQQPTDARAPSPANSHRSRNSHKSHRRPASSTKWRSPDSSDSEDYKSKKSGRSSRHRRQTESSDEIDDIPPRHSVERERRRERVSNDREKPRMSHDREKPRMSNDREKPRRESPYQRQKSRDSDKGPVNGPPTSPETPDTWACNHCTFINDALDKICAICCKSRPNDEKKRRFKRKDEREKSRSRASSLKGSKPTSPESSSASEEENALPVVLSNMSFKISSKATPTVTTTPASPPTLHKDNGPARSPLDDAQNRPNSTTRSPQPSVLEKEVTNEEKLDVQESIKLSSGKSTPDRRDSSFLRQYLEKSLFAPVAKNRTISESSCEEIKEIFKNMKQDDIEDFFAPVLPDEARDCDYETVAKSVAKENVLPPVIDEDEGVISCADTLRDMQSALASEIVDEPCVSASEGDRKEYKRISRYEVSPEKSINFDDFPVLDYLPPMLTEGESLKLFEVSIGVDQEVSGDKSRHGEERSATPVNVKVENCEGKTDLHEDQSADKKSVDDERKAECITIKEEEKLIYGIHTQLRDSIEDSASSSDQAVGHLATTVAPCGPLVNSVGETIEAAKAETPKVPFGPLVNSVGNTIEAPKAETPVNDTVQIQQTAVAVVEQSEPTEMSAESQGAKSPLSNLKEVLPISAMEKVEEISQPVSDTQRAVDTASSPLLEKAAPLEKGTSPLPLTSVEPAISKMMCSSTSTSPVPDILHATRETSVNTSTSTSTDQDITSVVEAPPRRTDTAREDADYWEREKAKMKQNMAAPKKTMTSTGTSPLPQSIATQTYDDVEIPEVPPPQIRRPSRDEDARSAGYPSPKPRRVSRGISLDDNPRGAFHYIDPMGYHSGYEIKARSLSREPSPHRGRSETPDRRYPSHPPPFDPWSRGSSSSWDLRSGDDQRDWRRGGHWEDPGYPWDYSGYSNSSRYKGSTGSLTSYGTSSSGLISRDTRSEATSLFNSYEDVSTSSVSDLPQRRPPDLADLLREAANEGFGPDDVRIALGQCGSSHPIDWLRQNWTTMIDKIVIKATKYGQKQTRNTVGAISRQEAVASLRRHKGNVQLAIQSCIKQRQKKYVHLATKGNFSHEDIVTSLTAAKGDVNEALNELLGTASDKDTDSRWSSVDTTTASDVTLKPHRKKSKTRESRRHSMKNKPALDYEVSDTESLRPGTSMSSASSSIVSSGGTVVPDDTEMPEEDWEDPTTADFDMTSYTAQPDMSFRPASSLAGPSPNRKRHSSGPVSQASQPMIDQSQSSRVQRSSSRADRRKSMIDQSMVTQSLASMKRRDERRNSIDDRSSVSEKLASDSTQMLKNAPPSRRSHRKSSVSDQSISLAPSLMSDFTQPTSSFTEVSKGKKGHSTVSQTLAPSLVSDFTQPSTTFTQVSATYASEHRRSPISQSLAPSLVSDFTQPSTTFTQASVTYASEHRKSPVSQSIAPSLVSDFTQPSTDNYRQSTGDQSTISQSLAPSLVSDFSLKQDSTVLTEESNTYQNVTETEHKTKSGKADMANILNGVGPFEKVERRIQRVAKQQPLATSSDLTGSQSQSASSQDSVLRSRDATNTSLQTVVGPVTFAASHLHENLTAEVKKSARHSPMEEKELSVSEYDTSDQRTLLDFEEFDYIDDSDDEILFARDYSPVDFRYTSLGEFTDAPTVTDPRLIASEPANPFSAMASDPVQPPNAGQSINSVKDMGSNFMAEKNPSVQVAEQKSDMTTTLAQSNSSVDAEDVEKLGNVATPISVINVKVEINPSITKPSDLLQPEAPLVATSPRSSSSSFISAVSGSGDVEDLDTSEEKIIGDQIFRLSSKSSDKVRSPSPSKNNETVPLAEEEPVDQKTENETPAVKPSEDPNQIDLFEEGEKEGSLERHDKNVVETEIINAESSSESSSKKSKSGGRTSSKIQKNSSSSDKEQASAKAPKKKSPIPVNKDKSLSERSSEKISSPKPTLGQKSPLPVSRGKSPLQKSCSEKQDSAKPSPKPNSLSPVKLGSRTPSPQAYGKKLVVVSSPRLSRSPSGKDSLDVPDYRELSKSPVNDNTDNSAIEDLPDDSDSQAAPGLIDYQEAITPEPLPVVVPVYVPTISIGHVVKELEEEGTQKEASEDVITAPVDIHVVSSSSQSKVTADPNISDVSEVHSEVSTGTKVQPKSLSANGEKISPASVKASTSSVKEDEKPAEILSLHPEGDMNVLLADDGAGADVSSVPQPASLSTSRPEDDEANNVEVTDDVESDSDISIDSQIELSHSVEYDDVGPTSQDRSDHSLEPVNPGEFDAEGQVEIVSVNEGVGFKRLKTSAAKLLSSRLSRIMTAEGGESFRPTSASPISEEKSLKLSKVEELFQSFAEEQERRTNESGIMADLEVALKRTKAVLEEAENSLRDTSPEVDDKIQGGKAEELLEEAVPSTSQVQESSEIELLSVDVAEGNKNGSPPKMAAAVEEAVLALEASTRKSPPKSPPLRKVERAKDSQSLLWRLVEEGRVPNMEKAQLAAHLVDLRFGEDEAIEAALECNSIFSALSYLRQECELCATKYSAKEMVSMLNCIHRCCRSCAAAYFSTQIRDRPLHELVCPFCREPSFTEGPEEEAHEYFMHLEIMLKGLLDVPVFELYERKLRDWTLSKDPNFWWCHKCSSGFFIDPSQSRHICPDCSAVTCAGCRKPWRAEHDRMTCEEYVKFLTEEEMDSLDTVAKLLAEGIKCPKCSFQYALARGGCMHFTCTQCKFEFCSGCGKPFKMGARCTVGPRCARLGLHAHHPRNCLFYLRDKEPEELQKLLKDNGVHFDVDGPIYDNPNALRRCKVQIQKETPRGFEDDVCGGDIGEGFAGLCRTHYIEYLAALVTRNKLDPIPIFSADDLETVVYRENKKLPSMPYGTPVELYRTKLLEVIRQEIPL